MLLTLLAIYCLVTYFFNGEMVAKVLTGVIDPRWLLVWLFSPIVVPIMAIVVVFFG